MTLFFTNTKERGRFFRFAVVGVIGAVIDFGVFNLLTSAFRFPAVLASVISFLAAVSSNFTWNRYWTYPDSRSKHVSRQLIQFTIISLIGLAIRTPLFVLLERLFSRWFLALNLPAKGFLNSTLLAHNLALAVAVVVVMFWNFFINRYWTYSDVS
ncbi:MAG: GtrA family protein [Anaerolineales bacterium]